jgi:protein TonB
MSKGSVFDYGWIDLVFEGRNQKYGAYQLRRQDARTTILALFSGIGLIGLLVGIPAFVNYLKDEGQIVETLPKDPGGIVLHEVELQPLPEKPKPAETQAAAPASPANPQPTVEFKPLASVTGPVETPEPTTTQVLSVNAGQTTTPGTGENNFTINTPTGTGGPGSTGTAPTGLTGNEPLPPAMLDNMPEFPGGLNKFREYVGNNFKSPENETAEVIKVYVSFVIEKDGSMTNITVPRDPGHGMGREAIRVLKSLKTKWKPGYKNGQPVRTSFTLPISVQLK